MLDHVEYPNPNLTIGKYYLEFFNPTKIKGKIKCNVFISIKSNSKN